MMKTVGVLMALVGWIIPVVSLPLTQSLSARFVASSLGLIISLVGILGVLNQAHLKEAIWKK
jgi:predicted nucleic acid-binding protein